uniref:Zn(2)-C6 fungal-type domain-containing protein n=1 Tax=Mycena chlorophos TaxID=658473 RepID=A0ABQ0LII4_MYCCL|nr:predicted protein [Mycena chlorophos]
MPAKRTPRTMPDGGGEIVGSISSKRVRTKAGQACAACRKSKARCEITAVAHGRCHRPGGEEQDSALAWLHPMGVVRDICAGSSTPAAAQASGRDYRVTSLNDILAPGIRERLVALFDTHYRPWLSFDLARDDFVDASCCTVALSTLESFPLPLETSSRLAGFITAHLRGIPNAVESVQGLTILAVWFPAGLLHDTLGPRSLLQDAVRMALGLGLNDSVDVDEIRLWTALMTLEALHSLGTDVAPLTTIRVDPRRLHFPRTENLYREATLLRVDADSTAEEREAWLQEMCNVLSEMVMRKRLLAPLSVTAPLTHRPLFLATQIAQDLARILTLYHAFIVARGAAQTLNSSSSTHMGNAGGGGWQHAFLPDSNPPPKQKLTPGRDADPRADIPVANRNNAEKLLRHWGADMLRTTETLLVSFLHLTEVRSDSGTGAPSIIQSLPDVFIIGTAFGAALLVGMNFVGMRRLGREVLGAGMSELLIRKVARALVGDDGDRDGEGGIARQAGAFVQRVLAKWEARHGGKTLVAKSGPKPGRPWASRRAVRPRTAPAISVALSPTPQAPSPSASANPLLFSAGFELSLRPSRNVNSVFDGQSQLDIPANDGDASANFEHDAMDFDGDDEFNLALDPDVDGAHSGFALLDAMLGGPGVVAGALDINVFPPLEDGMRESQMWPDWI